MAVGDSFAIFGLKSCLNGIITRPDEVGGWPELAEGTLPVDSDRDGMPDEWKKILIRFEL